MDEEIKQEILNVRQELFDMKQNILHPEWIHKVGLMIDKLDIIVSRVELPVKPANGDIAIDILDEKEKYYSKLLKDDIRNHDHIACIVCESKLDFINEMQKELVSRLSV